jgi:hypothetical protein
MDVGAAAIEPRRHGGSVHSDRIIQTCDGRAHSVRRPGVALPALPGCRGSPARSRERLGPPLQWAPMADTGWDAGRVLRSLISGGWADEDADVMSDLLDRAQELASRVVADDGASAEVRSVAADLLDRLRSDTFRLSGP